MPLIEQEQVIEQEQESRHSEDLHEIITSPPSWILRWGISTFFAILILIVTLSAVIRYPDVVKTRLVINSSSSPKPVVAKVSGKLIRILVTEGQAVTNNQPLAYIESTALHTDVLKLLKNLKTVQNQMLNGGNSSLSWMDSFEELQLGELQNSYQSFYHSYLAYKASIGGGYYLRQKEYLKNDLENILKKKTQLLAQQELQEKMLELAEEQYTMHRRLAEKKVEAIMELKREEALVLQKMYPLEQTKAALVDNLSAYTSKEKEILELDNRISEEKIRFIQSLNSLISETESWRNNYVLYAGQPGKVAFAGIRQENQVVKIGEEIFYTISGTGSFFGEMPIPQFNMGKVRTGQRVLVKLNSYPFEEYGMLSGHIAYIAEIPHNDSMFISTVTFSSKPDSELKRPITLKNGMMAEAEIITQEASLLERVNRSIFKVLK